MQVGGVCVHGGAVNRERGLCTRGTACTRGLRRWGSVHTEGLSRPSEPGRARAEQCLFALVHVVAGDVAQDEHGPEEGHSAQHLQGDAQLAGAQLPGDPRPARGLLRAGPAGHADSIPAAAVLPPAVLDAALLGLHLGRGAKEESWRGDEAAAAREEGQSLPSGSHLLPACTSGSEGPQMPPNLKKEDKR
uniref:Small integral membrane protein 1 n=1 Tax=Sus scrofa TaxID=9823 RepID=A0A480ING6_PIG